MTKTDVAPVITPDDVKEVDTGWVVIVYDDPVNLMQYVVYVFQKTLEVDKPTAEKLMLQVHNEGKAVVWHGTKERAEAIAATLQGWLLWAMISKA